MPRYRTDYRFIIGNEGEPYKIVDCHPEGHVNGPRLVATLDPFHANLQDCHTLAAATDLYYACECLLNALIATTTLKNVNFLLTAQAIEQGKAALANADSDESRKFAYDPDESN